MISSISTNSHYITTSKSVPGYFNSYNSSSGSLVGLVRYTNGGLEAYDGNNWINISTMAEIILSSDMKNILDWAKQKMQEEQQLDQLMEKYPSLKSAYEAYRNIKIIVESEESNPHGTV